MHRRTQTALVTHGQGRHPETAEEEELRTGISLGLSLIDTSGDYGNGRSEKLIGRAIAG